MSKLGDALAIERHFAKEADSWLSCGSCVRSGDVTYASSVPHLLGSDHRFSLDDILLRVVLYHRLPKECSVPTSYRGMPVVYEVIPDDPYSFCVS